MTENSIDRQHLKILEALIFASSEPVSIKTLEDRMPDGVNLDALLNELKLHYDGRGINLVRVGKSWAFRTNPDVSELLQVERTTRRKLSRAAIETLAICAYHQPVTRAEIEEIRGVGLSKGTIDILFQAGWIKPRGRRKTPGRPVTWGTTEVFLDQFGMESIDDLPGMDELKAAGLIDKRPAIQMLSARSEMSPPEEFDEQLQSNRGDDEKESHIDPYDGDELANFESE